MPDEPEHAYPFPMTRKEMMELTHLIEWARKFSPSINPLLAHTGFKMDDVLDRGCFTHGRLCERFTRFSKKHRCETTHTICPECDPKEYARLKAKYGGDVGAVCAVEGNSEGTK